MIDESDAMVRFEMCSGSTFSSDGDSYGSKTSALSARERSVAAEEHIALRIAGGALVTTSPRVACLQDLQLQASVALEFLCDGFRGRRTSRASAGRHRSGVVSATAGCREQDGHEQRDQAPL